MCYGAQAASYPATARGGQRRQAAFTLVELLIAMVLTLIMVYAIAEFYAYVGDTVRDGRATIEMGGQLRAATQRMKTDLASLTVQVQPWTDSGNNSGYFEYFEGPASDSNPAGTGIASYSTDTNGDGSTDSRDFPDLMNNNTVATNLTGDGDDLLAFTINAGAEPFQGRFNGTIVTSRQAEVMWWCSFKDGAAPPGNANQFDADEPRSLFRRQLLILSQSTVLDATPYTDYASARAALVTFWQNNDVSAHVQANASGTTYQIYSNTLADLARRENRFAHNSGFPAPLLYAGATAYLSPSYILTGNSQGEDIMLSNLLAFDVRAYDPEVIIRTDSSSTVAVLPGQPGYESASTASSPPRGGYVDLNYDRLRGVTTSPPTTFSAAPNTLSQLGTSPNIFPTYDTWALSYEKFGPGTGLAMNGLDDNNLNGVDDPGERVTSPPYPVALRGIQVTIRIYDASSRQPRQASVIGDFVAE